MPRSFRAASITTAAVAFALLAGCSSSSDESNDSSPPASGSATPSSTATSSASTSSTPTSSPASGTSAGDGLASALITAADVGTGYETTATGTTDSPLPCTPGKQPLFMQAPPAQKVQRSFVNSAATVQVGETVAEYSEDTGAEQAFRIASAGFSCSSGTIGGQKVTIAKRTTGNPGSDVDDFAVWDFAAGQLKGTAVIARVDDHIAAMTFSAAGAAGNAVPVGTIVERAIAKVVAHD